MDKQESLQNKFGKLFNTITSIPKQLAEAVEEGLKEPSNLVCIQEGLLNFERIEEDVKRIQGDLRARGDKVLGSHLILDHQDDLMEIRTYTERGDKTFVITVDAEVKLVTNIPADIVEELQQKGRVELNLKLLN
ncbi:MAG: hypothetical protein ACSI46_17950 [Gloeotrichia echinulata DVL01]|jgi:hypothetical protein